MTDLSYESQLIAHYRGVRARLWGPKLPMRHVLAARTPLAPVAVQKPHKSMRDAIMTLRESHLIDDPYKLADVLKAVSVVTSIPLSELVSHRRTDPIARARQLFFWIAQHYTTQSHARIARQTNLNASSSVFHAIKKINADQARWQPKIDAVLNLLGGGK